MSICISWFTVYMERVLLFFHTLWASVPPLHLPLLAQQQRESCTSPHCPSGGSVWRWDSHVLCVKWSSHWLFEQISSETVTTQESHTPTATLSFAFMITDPVSFADCWSHLNTFKPGWNRIFLTGSRAEHQTHVLFVYLAVSLFTKGFAWNVNFLFTPQPALCGSPWKYSLIPQSVLSVQPGQAELLFYSDEWGPVFTWRIRQTQTVHVKIRASVKLHRRCYTCPFVFCLFSLSWRASGHAELADYFLVSQTSRSLIFFYLSRLLHFSKLWTNGNSQPRRHSVSFY